MYSKNSFIGLKDQWLSSVTKEMPPNPQSECQRIMSVEGMVSESLFGSIDEQHVLYINKWSGNFCVYQDWPWRNDQICLSSSLSNCGNKWWNNIVKFVHTQVRKCPKFYGENWGDIFSPFLPSWQTKKEKLCFVTLMNCTVIGITTNLVQEGILVWSMNNGYLILPWGISALTELKLELR